MFRYGGPIKEGIMDGMKDNRQAINTVGSPLAPKDETGRGGYAVPLLAGLGAAALRMAPYAARGVSALRNLYSRQVPAAFSRVQPKTTGGGYMEYGGVLPSTTRLVPGGTGPVKGLGMTRELRPFIQRDPVLRTLFGAGKVGAKAAGPVKSALKYSFTTPTGLALTGYMGGKSIYDAMTGEKTPEAQAEIEAAGGPPGGGDPNMFARPKQEVVSEDKLEQMNKDRIQATKDKYYKMMGLDKMNKEAAYDSLIKASKIISEEGADLKGAVKSGTLQSRIIDAISGELDKSKTLKRQVDAAVLKGEIEKDIKASDPSAQLAAELTKKKIELADKQLAGGNLIENIQQGAKDFGGVNNTSNVYNAILKTYKVEPEVLADTSDTAKFRKSEDYTTDSALVKRIVEAQNKGPGIYIVDKTAVLIDENGNASTLFQG